LFTIEANVICPLALELMRLYYAFIPESDVVFFL